MLEKEWVAENRLLKAVGFVPSIPDWLKLWYHALENVSAILTMQGGEKNKCQLAFPVDLGQLVGSLKQPLLLCPIFRLMTGP